MSGRQCRTNPAAGLIGFRYYKILLAACVEGPQDGLLRHGEVTPLLSANRPLSSDRELSNSLPSQKSRLFSALPAEEKAT